MNTRASARLDVVTTWGVIQVYARNGVLIRCDLPKRSRTPSAALRLNTSQLHGQTMADRRVLRQAEKFIRDCLQGRRPGVMPALQLESCTTFTARVLAALRRIPWGATATYGDMARRIGAPRAARAVGTACGANPLALFIPCHRVVANGGALGGFSAGLAWKRLLLEKERAS